MRYLALILALSALFTSCKVKVISIKNDDGILISKHQELRKKGQRHGYYKIYHDNGQIALEMKYKNGKLHGEERGYYENGQLQSVATSVMGSYEGEFKYWYTTGVLMQEGKYINNNIEGELKTYYPNAVLKETVTFSKTLENGPYTMYYQNGKIKEEGFFINGPFPDGTVKQYNDEGILIRKQQCETGSCTVVWELNPTDKGDK